MKEYGLSYDQSIDLHLGTSQDKSKDTGKSK